MKKVFLGFLALAMLASCNEESIESPKADGTKYQVDFTLNGLEIETSDLHSKSFCKSASVDENQSVNVDLKLVAYKIDDQGKVDKLSAVSAFDFENEDFVLNQAKNLTINLTAGKYKVYAFASKNLSAFSVNTDPSFMGVLQATNNANVDLWAGVSTVEVKSNTTGSIKLNENYSIIEWNVTGVSPEHKTVNMYSEVFSGMKYELLGQYDIFYQKEMIQFGQGYEGESFTHRYFTFPGYDSNQIIHKIQWTNSEGKTQTDEYKMTQYDPRMIYKLNINIDKEGAVELEKKEWGEQNHNF